MYHSGTRLLDPHRLATVAQIRPGMHIADIGSGSLGHVLFPAVSRMDNEGVAYAVDIRRDALQHIHARAQSHKTDIVHTVWGDIERHHTIAIPPNSLDVVFVVNTLSQLSDHDEAMKNVVRLLKPKSRIVLVDWAVSKNTFPLAPERQLVPDFFTNWALLNNFVTQEEIHFPPYLFGYVLFRHE